VDQIKHSWDTGDNGIGIKSKITYPVEPTPAVMVKDGRDLTQEQLDALRRELAAQRALLEAMQKKPAQAPAPAPAKTTTPPPAPKYRPMMFVANTIERTEHLEPDTYQLAPGATKLPCIVETAMNSDIESHSPQRRRTGLPRRRIAPRAVRQVPAAWASRSSRTNDGSKLISCASDG
jgi:hypothetical protein